MARARNIKPSLFKNEILGTADPLLTILFQSLWCLADKAGRLEDRPLRIKAETFPYRDNLDINAMLTQLVSLDFVWRYKVENKAYIQVIKFTEHQSPHSTEKASKIPACPPEYQVNMHPSDIIALNNASLTQSAHINVLIPDSLNTDSLNPIKPRKKSALAYDDYPEFLEFWSIYPRHDDKRKSLEAWAKVKPPIQQVLQALEWQVPMYEKSDAKFVPMPTTYLNNSRWEDEPPRQLMGAPF